MISKKWPPAPIEEYNILIETINTMFEITEAEAGVGVNNIEVFDLNKLISGACEIFQPIADNKNIAINLSAANEINFRSDPRKVQRIVTNLLENAIKYTPEQGKISISVLARERQIDCVIEDTGIGISPDDLPRIFERFYRSEKSRSGGGIGLGLSLTKAFVEALGGVITVTSALGKGSTFAFSLPKYA